MNPKNPKNFFQVLLVILFVFCSLVSAQDETAQPKQITEATKIEEIGRAGECDRQVRIDGLIELLPEKAEIYIIVYQGKDALPANYNKSEFLFLYKSDLVNRKGLDENRIHTIFGGFREKEITEFWIVPEGAIPPEPTYTIEPPKIPVGKTYLFDSKLIELDSEFYFPVNEEPEAVVEEEIEAETNETPEVENAVEETSEEIIEEEPTYTPEELDEIKFSWVNTDFAKKIKATDKARGILIFYADDESIDIGKLQLMVSEGSKRLADSESLNLDRFKVIYGGFVPNGLKIEMWIVPKNGKMPVPTPAERETETEEN